MSSNAPKVGAVAFTEPIDTDEIQSNHNWVLSGKDDPGPDGIFYLCVRCGATERVFRDYCKDNVRHSVPGTAVVTCAEEICRRVLED